MFNSPHRWLSCTLPAALLLVAAASATPADARVPYPDTGQYRNAGSLEKFKLYFADGLWFSTPLGFHCGIGEDSSFGCSGSLPGTKFGENEVAWFPGDPFPRLYQTDQPRFDSGANQQPLPSNTVLRYRGISCAVTMESGVYCGKLDDPNSQIMVASGMTYRGSNGLPAS